MFLALHDAAEAGVLPDARGRRRGHLRTDAHARCSIANAHGIFGVYSMRDVIEYERFWASGSGGDYALGAMHALY